MLPNRLAVWSGPRNISTALMYSFAQRADTRVLDEPLFAYFLDHTGVQRPSREEVLGTMETNPLVVIEEQLLGPTDRPILFMKHMANHIEGLDWSFVKEFRNIILTRHPRDVVASYSKHIEQPTLLDLAYEHQVRMIEYLDKGGQNYAVLDSATVCNQPEQSLKALCSWADIPFGRSMLSWKPGPIPEDGIWAKYWYQSVHRSKGFTPYISDGKAIPKHLQPLIDACLPLYQRLVENTLI